MCYIVSVVYVFVIHVACLQISWLWIMVYGMCVLELYSFDWSTTSFTAQAICSAMLLSVAATSSRKCSRGCCFVVVGIVVVIIIVVVIVVVLLLLV